MPEAKDAYQALFIETCRRFAWALEQRGRIEESRKFAKMADQFVRQYRERPNWEQELGLHAAADAVNAKLPNQREAKGIYAREFADPIDRLSYSAFNEYFVLQAMAQLGKYDDAIRTVRDLWGGQLRYGGTCFFEVYRASWNDFLKANDPVPNGQAGNTSLCHPWSSGVTSWLSEEVLGVKAASPGFSTYPVLPHLGRTLSWVRGRVPSPHGTIDLDFDGLHGIMRVQAPTSTKGTIGIPKQERAIRSIKCNGQLAWDGRFHMVDGIAGAHEDRESVYFTDVQPGRYTFEIQFNGDVPKYLEAPTRYRATTVKEDTTTQGDWPGHYGGDGYILFGHADKNHSIAGLYLCCNPSRHFSWAMVRRNRRPKSTSCQSRSQFSASNRILGDLAEEGNGI